ncbi:MAG: hypothetical protein FWH47_00400 [Methanomassiliicoccaceae archaeon]|nr:hypothetical protein [Methanomassiliicoccaceae archaeon]
MFETNSSSAHTFIHISKETFEDWVLGGKALVGDECGIGRRCYDEEDFKDTNARLKHREARYTYNDLLEFYSKLKPGLALKDDPDRDFVDPNRWSMCDEEFDESDFFEREPSMNIEDDGKTVEISIWGNDH